MSSIAPSDVLNYTLDMIPRDAQPIIVDDVPPNTSCELPIRNKTINDVLLPELLGIIFEHATFVPNFSKHPTMERAADGHDKKIKSSAVPLSLVCKHWETIVKTVPTAYHISICFMIVRDRDPTDPERRQFKFLAPTPISNQYSTWLKGSRCAIDIYLPFIAETTTSSLNLADPYFLPWSRVVQLLMPRWNQVEIFSACSLLLGWHRAVSYMEYTNCFSDCIGVNERSLNVLGGMSAFGLSRCSFSSSISLSPIIPNVINLSVE